ncbi:MAG: hypothetical protein PHU71_05360 [Candidatus Gracilibacteria bacterium]|nr:hypothetical protein [Candidatus Gracilibacteria bacterium]
MQKKTIILLVFVALLLSTALYGISRYGQTSILRRQKTELGQQVNFYVEVPGVGNEENSDIGLKVNSQITGDQLEITGFEIAWVDETFIQSAAEYLRDNPEEDDLSGFFNESPLDFGKRVFLPMINKVAIQNETTPQKVKLSKQPEILTAYTGEKAEILEKVFGTQMAYASDEEGEESDAPADGDSGDGDCAWYDIGCWMGKAWNATKEYFNDAWDDFNRWWDNYWNDEDRSDESNYQLGACTTPDGECYPDVMNYYCESTLYGTFTLGSCPEDEEEDDYERGACTRGSDCSEDVEKGLCELDGGSWKSGSCSSNESDWERGACTRGSDCSEDVEKGLCLRDGGSWKSGSCSSNESDWERGACTRGSDCSEDVEKGLCELDGGSWKSGSCSSNESDWERGACTRGSDCSEDVEKGLCLRDGGSWKSGSCSEDEEDEEEEDNDQNDTNWYNWKAYWASQGDMYPGEGQGGDSGYDSYSATTKGACYLGDDCSRQKKGVCEDMGGLWTAQPLCPGYDTSQQTEKLQRN